MKKSKSIIVILVMVVLLVGLPSYAKAEEIVTEEVATNYLTVHEKAIANGESFELQLPSGMNCNYTIEGNYYCVGVQRSEYTTSLWITGYSSGEATIVVWFYDQDWNYIASESCKVSVIEKGLEESSLICAVGKTAQLHMSGYEQTQAITWTSSNVAVAKVNEAGLVTGVAKGEADITATCVETDGTVRTYTCRVAISDPKIKESSGNLAVGCTKELKLTGLQAESTVTLTTSNASVAEVNEYSNSIYAIKKGTATIKCVVDGVCLTYKVTVTDPEVNVSLVPLVKGKKAKIKVTGTNKNSTITFKSSTKSIATVDKNGSVTGKKTGCTCIQISVDGKEMSVPVSVGSAKVINALKYAMDAVGTPYSQAKRMENGYYDCSSLTWRAYHSAGVNIGSKWWAPTAADIAKTLVQNKKAIAYKALPVEKMQPGDLLFFAKTDGTDNGRYKNIYHVGIYCGSNGDAYGSGLLLEARLCGVGIYTYYPEDRKVVVVARPTK
ncbi:Ig-like domain-containing protein [Anaerosporobacter sp.]|uniref:Ig-like domain-containing protein n=1 Tax=Anaerosporobacter sp. TaxID=1872529 RepID=UPI00286ED7D5|nr:Ig-like domain-containing protein [Anaerosporobacter sp.]